ncbi:unnamed protein product [Caenorhabditis angaria]|uniref:W02B3.4-like N-terminal domain-containing protein n=1 Tax=Caenorhabditis angaria TaxID=860376 RepID=A0A9P1IH58_9PELO|nr:unnamed protein product [Caenorhabditis angaria]
MYTRLENPQRRSRMRRIILLFSMPCCFIIPILFYQTSILKTTFSTSTLNESEKCVTIESLQTKDVRILILDEDFLRSIQNGTCEKFRKIEIGIDLKYLKNREILKDPRFEVIFFANETKKDYFDLRTEPRRIIPKRFESHQIGNIYYPKNIPQFLGFLKRSKYIDCLNLYIPRKGQKVFLNAARSAQSLAQLRDKLLDFDMFSFLNGGTLLGWYRECSIIPHTYDMDVSVFIEDINPKILDYFQSAESEFTLARKFGRINDSLELTVYSNTGYAVNTDVFFMYTDDYKNGTIINWVGGMNGNGGKYKFTYPKYDPWCAGDLLGHIFWVTCSPNQQITLEYGKLWYKDHPTTKYQWNESGKNVKPNGNWTKEDMKSVFFWKH